MKKNIRQKAQGLFLLIFFLFAKNVFSQEALLNINSSWSNVMPGKAICEPVKTSYGFALITDAKNIMTYTNNGIFLWERKLSKITSPSIYVLPQDFILVTTNSKKTLTLYNPSGSEIWSKTFSEELFEKPKAGRDGRFFIRNDHSISCYGITGVEKWKLEVPKMKCSEIQEFKDGSLLVFLEELDKGKSKGIRFSPFGELLEEITFSSEITSSLSCNEGILVTFKDSTCTLLDIENNKTEKKWVLQKDKHHPKINKDFFISSNNKENVIYLNHWTNRIEIDFISLTDGQLVKSFFTDKIEDVKESFCSNNGIFITDGKKAYFYSFTGVEIWSGVLPSEKTREAWNYCIYTKNDYFIIFTKNWNMNAFRTAQSSSTLEEKIIKKDYSKLYDIDKEIYTTYYLTSLNKSLASEERIALIKAGDYGKNEKIWSSELISACYALQASLSTTNFGARVEKTGFETDTAGVELILKQLSLWGTDTYCNFTAYFLKNQNNSSLIYTLLKGINENAYDPEGVILDALELLSDNSNTRNEIILEGICDAVYEICMFMGRPAFNSKGKQILSTMLYPRYSSRIRMYARDTLKKVSSLDL